MDMLLHAPIPFPQLMSPPMCMCFMKATHMFIYQQWHDVFLVCEKMVYPVEEQGYNVLVPCVLLTPSDILCLTFNSQKNGFV
jgi:hypothetical protein